MKRIPVRLDCPNAVNLVTEKYDAEGLCIAINGQGRTTVTIRDGEFRITPNTLYTVTAGSTSSVESDSEARLSFAVQLDGQVRLSVSGPT
jgi:hypothetical protein